MDAIWSSVIVDDPAAYRWSSYRHNALGQLDSLMTEHTLYRQLGPDRRSRQASYRALFAQALDPVTLAAIRQATHKGWALGDDRFAEMVEAKSGRRTRPLRSGPKKPVIPY